MCRAAVGVFETVVLRASRKRAHRRQAAALLLFRLIYFILPFVLALAVLALYEALVVVRSAAGASRAAAWGAGGHHGLTSGALSPMARWCSRL